MHVLVVINALGEGGTERSMAELIPRIERQGVRFTIAILRSRGVEGVEPWLRAAGYDIRRLPGGYQRIRAYRRLVRELRPDIVHSMLYESNMLVRVGGVGVNPKVITSLVNTSYSAERFATPGTHRVRLRVVQGIDAFTGRMAVDQFHAVSESVKQDAVSHLRIQPTRITVVRRGRSDPRHELDPEARDATRRELGIPRDAIVAINLGRHEFQKDHGTLLDAVAPLVTANPALWLLVAGREGNASGAIATKLATIGERSRIRILGHRSDVNSLLAAADLFVMTSRYEGLPGAVIEAMAAGLPVVASDIGPVREVVEPGSSSLLAAVGDSAGFGRAVRRLVEDVELRRALGDRGRQIFNDRFTLDAAARGMGELYERVVRR